MKHSVNRWIVCQLGARERYAIPRALHAQGLLRVLITDVWVPPGSLLAHPMLRGKLSSRWHHDLKDTSILAMNRDSVFFEFRARLAGKSDWDLMITRNDEFQKQTIKVLREIPDRGEDSQPLTVFCYSYSALEIFRYAKKRGWRTVLGQIDLGPKEDELEKTLLDNHPEWQCSTIESPPHAYWDKWREEWNLADRVIVNSDWARAGMIEEGMPPDKVAVIPLAYEPESSRRSLGTRAPIPSEDAAKTSVFPTAASSSRLSTLDSRCPLHVLFLGQIVARKGIYDLIEAARLLDGESVVFDVVGPFQSLPPSLPPNIRFHGRVNQSEASGWYDQADVFVLPTHSDGFALTQLEAMSHGLPVITTPCCGDVVRDGWNGFLFSPGDVTTLASIVRNLIHDRSPLASMRLHATETLQGFSLKSLGRELCKLDSNLGVPE